jgi:hypothetical protein
VPHHPPTDPARRRARTARFAAWIALVVLLLPGQLLWLYLLRDHHLLAREPLLIGGQLLLGLAAVAVLALLKTTPPDAIRLPTAVSRHAVVAGCALLQLAAVTLLAPLTSNDVFRYRADGRAWLAGVSPYTTPPRDLPPSADPADALVPYPDWRTVYPPVSQAVFAAARGLDDHLVRPRTDRPPAPPAVSGRTDGAGGSATTREVAGDTTAAPATAWRPRTLDFAVRRHTVVFRAAFAAFAVAATALLVATLRRAGDSPWWAAVVAWNPLLTLEVGGAGHQDALGLFLLAWTLHATRARRFRAAGIALALACGVKPVAALLLPFLWRKAHETDGFRGGRRMLFCFLATLAAAFAPVLAWQHGYAGWLDTLARFGRAWEFNGLLYEAVKALLGDGDNGRQMARAKDAARLLALLVLVGAALFLWQSRARVAEGGYWLTLLLLLCAPVAYPWYLIWPLAFVPLLRGPQGFAALVWAATAAASYTAWRTADWLWAVPPAWTLVQYLPVLTVLAVEVTRLARVVPLGRAVERDAASPAEPSRP